MSKKSRPWRRQQRDAIRRRVVIGKWRKFVRWYLFGHDSFVQNGGDWAAMARRLDREYECPLYKHRPFACVCLERSTRQHFIELGLVKVDPMYQGAGGWTNGTSREQERVKAWQARRAERLGHIR